MGFRPEAIKWLFVALISTEAADSWELGYNGVKQEIRQMKLGVQRQESRKWEYNRVQRKLVVEEKLKVSLRKLICDYEI
jgi:hypothetical protein